MNRIPPKIGEWLLYRLSDPFERDSIAGDFREFFADIAETQGALKANLWYWGHLVKSLPAFVKWITLGSFDMFKSYFKIAYRSIVRNGVLSAINIVGLGVAISCAIIFFLLLEAEYTSDRFHENAENIFLVTYQLEGEENIEKWGNSPEPLANALKTEFPQIKRAVRIEDRGGVIKVGDNLFNEQIRFADSQFLEMFTFLLAFGDKSSFIQKNTVFISEGMAYKYFGETDPIGEKIEIIFSKDLRRVFVVSGVAERFPVSSSFRFEILVPYENLKDISPQFSNDWSHFVSATFIELNDPKSIEAIASKTGKYIDFHNEKVLDRPLDSFVFEPLPTLSWESAKIRNSISRGSTPEALIMLFVIAMLLLLQACSNYVNISLASAARRFKEIGIRKVVGSIRSQLIFQFLGENILLCFMALVTGLLLTEFVLLPGLMDIVGSDDTLTLVDFFADKYAWMFLVALLFLTGVGAGMYPALFVSRLRPVNIFRGKSKKSSSKRFAGFLLSFQFGITFLILCLVVTFWQNNKYQMERDWGYDQNDVVNIRLNDESKYYDLSNGVSELSGVLSVSGTYDQIGRNEQQAVVEIDAKKHEVVHFEVGNEYLEMLSFNLREGRYFNRDRMADRETVVLVNELFVKTVEWDHGADKVITFNNKVYIVAGVLEDFHHNAFYDPIHPVMITLVPDDQLRYLSVKVQPGEAVPMAAKIGDFWKERYPESVYLANFQDAVFEQAFNNNKVITKIFEAIAIITLIISCVGLFGLITLMISKRTKELSIHKVHGASISKLVHLITWRFVRLLIISTAIAIPVGYNLLQWMLNGMYPYHIDLGAYPFVLATVVVFATAAFTISHQVYKSATGNPIDSLRHE